MYEYSIISRELPSDVAYGIVDNFRRCTPFPALIFMQRSQDKLRPPDYIYVLFDL